MNVEVEAPPREDRFVRIYGETSVIAYCDPYLEPVVEHVFDLLAELHGQGAVMHAGQRFPMGWTTLFLEVDPKGELVLREPDYSAPDPEIATRPDISASLAMLARQLLVLANVDETGQAVNYDQHVLTVRGALEEEDVYLVRVESPGGRLTGWRIAPTEERPVEEVDSLPVHEILRRRPELVEAMTLPPGYMAFYEGKDLAIIVDAKNEAVWRKDGPATTSPPGESEP